MNNIQPAGLLAIDVGNTRVKLGWFPSPSGCATAESAAGPLTVAREPVAPPADVLRVPHGAPDLDAQVLAWFESDPGIASARCVMSSVHPNGADLIRAVLSSAGSETPETLDHVRIGIHAELDEPAKVGVDRLLSAVVAARLKSPDEGAIVIDAGTATTVGLISPLGHFLGGAILPGIGLAAAALHERTAALPPVDLPDDDPPPIGRSTLAAMQSGLFWGAVGGVREIVERTRSGIDFTTGLFVTGGDGRRIAPLLDDARHVSDMVLRGIHLVAGAGG